MSDIIEQFVADLPTPEPTAPDGLPLGNRRDPFDELVYIMLTLMTRAQGAIDATWTGLLELTDGRLEDLDRVDPGDLEEVLRPVGFARKRRRQLRDIAASVRPVEGWVDELRASPTETLLERLQQLPGVGPKTAKCVAMYSLGRPVLPVDIHVLRVAKRLGLVPAEASWREADALLEASVPDHLKYDVHVRFVVHGRAVCTSRRPSCGTCPLSDRCPSAGTPGELRQDMGG